MTYPTPKLFTESKVLNQYMPALQSDSQATRELQQIAITAAAGSKLISFVHSQLIVGNNNVLTSVPIPKVIETEDGWKFTLVLSNEPFDEPEPMYESEDGSGIELIKVLELMLMTPRVRADDMFPEFEIIEWTL